MKDESVFFTSILDEENVTIIYLDMKEWAKEYTFQSEEEAKAFYDFSLKVGEFLENVELDEQLDFHRKVMERYLKDYTHISLDFDKLYRSIVNDLDEEEEDSDFNEEYRY